MCAKFLIIIMFFSHVQKRLKNFLKILHLYLPSSTISPYFNSSYYSFLTIFTLYPIFFNIISQNFFSAKTQWAGFNPQTPLAFASVQNALSLFLGRRRISKGSPFQEKGPTMENARLCLVAALARGSNNSWPVTEERRAWRPGIPDRPTEVNRFFTS